MAQLTTEDGPAYSWATNPARTNNPEPMVPPTPMARRSIKLKCRSSAVSEPVSISKCAKPGRSTSTLTSVSGGASPHDVVSFVSIALYDCRRLDEDLCRASLSFVSMVKTEPHGSLEARLLPALVDDVVVPRDARGWTDKETAELGAAHSGRGIGFLKNALDCECSLFRFVVGDMNLANA